jgi:hypothetical protein
LPECIALLLGYDETESRRVSADPSPAGALLAHAERAPFSASPTKLARAKPAWERLAPESVATSQGRNFADLPPLHDRRPSAPLPLSPRPSSLTAVVAWCSDPDGVTAAESLARQIAVALGFREQLPIVWHIASHSALLGWLRQTREVALPNPERAVLISSMRSLIIDVVDARPRTAPSLNGVPAPPVLLNAELVCLGYALDAIGPDRIHLLAPDLPIDATLRRQLARRRP